MERKTSSYLHLDKESFCEEFVEVGGVEHRRPNRTKEQRERKQSVKNSLPKMVVSRNAKNESKEHKANKNCVSLKELLDTKTRKQQIHSELQKHSLSAEELSSLMKDIAEPVDMLAMILEN